MITKYKEFIKCNESNVDNYNFSSDNDEYKYYFTSNGINGDIEKIIHYQYYYDGIYNLAYGDVYTVNGIEEINDENVSNNGDIKKIFATIYYSMLDFSSKHSGVFIVIDGSDDKRKRVYNGLIVRYFNELNDLYVIKGSVGSKIYDFVTGVQYETIILKYKK